MNARRLLILLGASLLLTGRAWGEGSPPNPPTCWISLFASNGTEVCVGETVVIRQTTVDCNGSPNIIFSTTSFNSAGTTTISAQCACDTRTSDAYLEFHVSDITNLTPASVTMCKGSYMDFVAWTDPSNSLKRLNWQVQPPYAGTFSIDGTKARFRLADNYEGATATILVSCGSPLWSASITVTNPLPITSQPVSQAVCPGSNAIFSVSATGIGLTYQWRKNGIDLVDVGSISGSHASTLTISNVPFADTICSNVPALAEDGVSFGYVEAGVAYTFAATGTASYECGHFLVDPDGAPYGAAYSPASSSFACPGLEAVSLVGKVNGACIQLGTSGTFVTPNSGELSLLMNDTVGGHYNNCGDWIVCITRTTLPTYDVIVTSDCGSQVSEPATLTVIASPWITLQPASQTRYIGQSAGLLVSLNSTGPFSYQWRKNGTPISGATSAMLTLNNVTTSHAGSYDVVVSNGCGMQTTSAVATLIVVTDSDGDGLPDDIDDNPSQYDHGSPSFTLTYPTEGVTIP